MLRWLAALILALMANPALAQEDPAAHYGTWKGTIGRYPVMVCLDSDEHYQVGAYYYLSQLKPIALMASDRSGRWIEEDASRENGSSWSAIAVDGDRLRGEWHDGTRSLAISLERQESLPVEDFDGPCSSSAFLGPRTGGDRIDETDASIDGHAYRKRSYVPAAHFSNVAAQSFQLLPAQPGDRLINAELAKDLPDGTANSDLMQCMGQTLDTHGTDGDYWFSSEPILIAPRWLATRDQYDQYCGGAHPSTWLDYRLFDRETGAKVDLFGWLNDDAVNRETFGDAPEDVYVTVKDALRKRILSDWPVEDEGAYEDTEEGKAQEAECREVLAMTNSWSPGLSLSGLLFEAQLPRVVMACGGTVTVPWSELEPFLSDEGKAGLAALRADEAP